MGGKGGGDSPDTVTHINRNVPEWVEAAGRDIYDRSKGTLGKGADQRVFGGERVAPLNTAQKTGIDNIWKSYGAHNGEMHQAGDMARQQYNTPHERVNAGNNSQRIYTNRFTDPNSQFGQYVEKIYNPMEKRLNQTADRALGREQLANAYAGRGNSSMGRQREDALMQQRQDQIGMLQANALNQANQFFQSDEQRALQALMGQAGVNQQDLDRQLKAQEANQTAGLQNKQLNLQAAQNLANTVLSKYNMNAQDIARLMSAGQLEQGQNQQEIDANREKWNELNNYDRMELEWLAKMLGQNSGGEMKSSTSQPGPNQGLQFAGAALPLITNFMK